MERSLVQKFAERFSLDPTRLLETLKATAFRQRDGSAPSNEQMAALLVVADQYGLNPFTREIFAFQSRDRGSIIPVVSVDGWVRIINGHPQFDGMSFQWADAMASPPGGMPCPEWCEVAIYRRDRSHPTVVREFLDEVYRPPGKGSGGYEVKGPWQSHTKRFLRHKTLIQGARLAFGFAGIHDEDEARRIVDAETVAVPVEAAAQPTPERQSALPGYPDEKFAEMLPRWVESIATGRLTADAVLAKVGTKYSLTAEQAERLRNAEGHAEWLADHAGEAA